MRYAGVTMCLVFLVGLAALPFAPETQGQPLPEEGAGKGDWTGNSTKYPSHMPLSCQWT
jgi:hypothetical protein